MPDSLLKIFYSNPDKHKKIFLERFSTPFAVHLDFEIKQFNHEKAYKAFFYYTQDLVLLLENIYTQSQNFRRLLRDIPEIVLHQFELSCLIDEVHATTSIEGIHSTHRELKEIVDGNSSSVHFSSIIKKYFLLMSGQFLHFHSCEEVRKFYNEFAHDEVIAYNPRNKLDGVLFRKDAADILSASGKILHRGITPEEKIIDALSYALGVLNDKNFPALVRIAIFHYLFVYVHPFYDGNGRTDRFISSCYIAEHLHYIIALSLSVTIKRQKKKYYDLINNTDNEFNCGDLTPFICGFLNIILKTIQDDAKKLYHKMEQLEVFRKRLFALVHDDNFSKLLADLLLQASTFYGQGLSMEQLIKLTGKSRNTLKKKINALPDGCVVVLNNRKKFYKINTMTLKEEQPQK